MENIGGKLNYGFGSVHRKYQMGTLSREDFAYRHGFINVAMLMNSMKNN